MIVSVALATALLLASCGSSDETDGTTDIADGNGTGDQVAATATPVPGEDDGDGEPGTVPTPGPDDGASPDDDDWAAERTPQPGGDVFSISIEGLAGCDTTEGSGECSVGLGESFTVSIHLNSLPAGMGDYQGWDGVILYSGVTSKESVDGDPWPECEFMAAYFETPGVVALGCALGIENAFSTHTGILATTEFECPAEPTSGSVALMHGEGYTVLWEDQATEWSEAGGTADTLTINCGAP
jgi:hypothetical protein